MPMKGWSLMIFCARATRGLRRVRGEPPDHPSCSQNAHDEKDGEMVGMVSVLAEPPR